MTVSLPVMHNPVACDELQFCHIHAAVLKKLL